MAKSKPPILVFDNYIKAINNSVGSKMFRNLYVKVKGKKVDVMRNGDLSCALYVSSVLYLFGLISRVHATVNSTVEDLKKSGWKEIKRPEIGSVVVYQARTFRNGETNKHLGFYIGKQRVVSNSDKKRFPVEHPLLSGLRKIEAILYKKVK